jgi:hypothetical protein
MSKCKIKTSTAIKLNQNDPIKQGDIFRNIKYSYIETENNKYVDIVEMDFSYAIIISQACDVVSMNELQKSKRGSYSKFMPSILMCPIYDLNKLKDKSAHLSEVGSFFSFDFDKDDGKDNIIKSDDIAVSSNDWHYRFHLLKIEIDKSNMLDNAVIDFKHYFCVPMSYLLSSVSNRIMQLDNVFAEQITLKFATFLTRMPIP